MKLVFRWRWLFPLTLLLLAGCEGCSKQVPQGTVGKVLTPSGWDEKVLEPGYRSCWGRDEMYLLDTGDTAHQEHLEILCADRLNFKCDVVIKSRPKNDEASRNALFGRLKAEDKGGQKIISGQQLYDTCVKPYVVPAVYDVVAKRETDQISTDMVAIKSEIKQVALERLGSDNPAEVLVIDFVNTDYPAAVTTRLEEKKAKQIDAEIARSEADAEVAREEGQLRVANKKYQVDLLEAKKIADCNLIIGDSLKDHPEFLWWHQIKVYGEAANGPNNVFIIPYDAMGGNGTMLSSVMQHQALEKAKPKDPKEEAALQAARQRIEAAQKEADLADEYPPKKEKTTEKSGVPPATDKK